MLKQGKPDTNFEIEVANIGGSVNFNDLTRKKTIKEHIGVNLVHPGH